MVEGERKKECFLALRRRAQVWMMEESEEEGERKEERGERR